MITTSKKPSYKYLRKLMVLPVATIIIFLFAFRYQTTQKDQQEMDKARLQSLINKSNTDTSKPLDDRTKFDKYLIVIDGVIQSQRGLKNIDSNLILKDGSFEIHFDKNGESKYGQKGKDGVIEITTNDATRPKSDVKKDKSEISLKEVWLTDTTKPKKDEPLIVIDGKPRPDLNFSKIETVVSVDKIESIRVLNDKNENASAKYGDMAKHGVIEINTKKIAVKEITLTEKKYEVDDDNKVFEKVEVEAAFRGGEKEWRNYLNRNLDVNVPVKNGCKQGTYAVIVQFIVAKDGKVSDVRALTDHGFGMEEEAMRMIKKGPDWIPAIQNGHNVKAYRRQPFTFVIVDNGKPNNSKSITKVKSFENDENIVFEKVETEAAFPGGVKGWREFLQKNLKSTVPVENGANKGTYTVITQFIVHKDGSISDVKTLTNHGHGMEDEVLRVMKESPNWIPATQNGCNVTAYRKQPVTFVIVDE